VALASPAIGLKNIVGALDRLSPACTIRWHVQFRSGERDRQYSACCQPSAAAAWLTTIYPMPTFSYSKDDISTHDGDCAERFPAVHAALIIHSSGSTGTAKVVRMSHVVCHLLGSITTSCTASTSTADLSTPVVSLSRSSPSWNHDDFPRLMMGRPHSFCRTSIPRKVLRLIEREKVHSLSCVINVHPPSRQADSRSKLGRAH